MTTAQKNHYYSSTESRGRELFEQLCEQEGWEVDFTQGTFDSFDAEIVDDWGKAIVEIKARGYASDAFPDWMLETKKLERLMKDRYDDEGVVYVNFYPDGVVRCWDVDAVLGALEEKEGTFSNLGSADEWHKKKKSHFGLDPEDAYIDYEWGVTYS